MDYHGYLPPDSLKPYVRSFWTLKSEHFNSGSHHIKTIVDDTSGILFQHNDGKSCLKDSSSGSLPIAMIYGLTIKPTDTVWNSKFAVTGIDFHPGAFNAIFNQDAISLTNQKIDLNHFAPKELTQKLLENEKPQQQIKLLTDFLISILNKSKKRDLSINAYIDRIKAGGDNLVEIQKYFQISERQLERKFKQAIGVSPKTFIRINRFQSAICEVRALQPKNFNHIAFKFNYADQSHFIKEFKEFSGFTPKRMIGQEECLLSKLIISY